MRTPATARPETIVPSAPRLDEAIQPLDEIRYSPQLAAELQRIATEVARQLDLERQQELTRRRDLARFD